MAGQVRCRECGSSVKAENLAAHYERVHPKAQMQLSDAQRWEVARATAPRPAPRPVSPGTWKVVAVILGVVLFLGVAVVGYGVLSAAGASGTIDLEPSSWDFGDIQQVTVSHTFTVRNAGTTPLRIDGISTSCMCTTAHVDYMGGSSPTFGYHESPSWSLVIAPGTQGSLTVHYDPTVHPERGHFERQVYILSSDPTEREAIVTIHVYEV